jgi:hypothetical protein
LQQRKLDKIGLELFGLRYDFNSVPKRRLHAEYGLVRLGFWQGWFIVLLLVSLSFPFWIVYFNSVLATIIVINLNINQQTDSPEKRTFLAIFDIFSLSIISMSSLRITSFIDDPVQLN